MPDQNQNYQHHEAHAGQQARSTARNGDILAVAQRGNVKIVYYKYNPNWTTQNTSGSMATQPAANDTHALQQTGFEFGYIHPTKRKTEDAGEHLWGSGRDADESDEEDVCMEDTDAFAYADDEDEDEDEDEGDDGDDEEESNEDFEVETRQQRQESTHDYDSEDDGDDEQADSVEDEDKEMPDYTPSLSPIHTYAIELRREKGMSRKCIYDDVDVGFDADESEVDGLERGEDVVGQSGDEESDEDDGDGGASSRTVEGSERSSHTIGRSEVGDQTPGRSEGSSRTVGRSEEGDDEWDSSESEVYEQGREIESGGEDEDRGTNSGEVESYEKEDEEEDESDGEGDTFATSYRQGSK